MAKLLRNVRRRLFSNPQTGFMIVTPSGPHFADVLQSNFRKTASATLTNCVATNKIMPAEMMTGTMFISSPPRLEDALC
jgi:hypothetical protein